MSFVIALPLGIVAGDAVLRQQRDWPLATPTIMALGAGTFLYLPTLHRHRDQADTRASGWSASIAGYLLMAAIAAADLSLPVAGIDWRPPVATISPVAALGAILPLHSITRSPRDRRAA